MLLSFVVLSKLLDMVDINWWNKKILNVLISFGSIIFVIVFVNLVVLSSK